MPVREPHVAGLFYPDDPVECRAELEACLTAAAAPVSPGPDGPSSLPERMVAAVVPHAGWRYSGRVCARALRALAAARTPDTVVLFGADHRAPTPTPALFTAGAWRTPLGEAKVDAELAAVLLSIDDSLDTNPQRHAAEHSIEVVVPFVQALFGGQVKILPILVPGAEPATALGQAAVAAAGRIHRDAVYVGSTDLTHYGAGYGFAPQGHTPAALRWAKEVNDRRVIDLMLAGRPEAVVAEVRAHHNACGPGAIAATAAAAGRLGAGCGVLLEHVTSREVTGEAGVPDRCVGYAAVVFGLPGPSD